MLSRASRPPMWGREVVIPGPGSVRPGVAPGPSRMRSRTRSKSVPADSSRRSRARETWWRVVRTRSPPARGAGVQVLALQRHPLWPAAVRRPRRPPRPALARRADGNHRPIPIHLRDQQRLRDGAAAGRRPIADPSKIVGQATATLAVALAPFTKPGATLPERWLAGLRREAKRLPSDDRAPVLAKLDTGASGKRDPQHSLSRHAAPFE